VYTLLEEKCYHTICTVFRGLLLAFFFNDRFSNMKLDGNIRICVPRRRTDRRGANFVKLGGEFSGGWVFILLEEKCYHTVRKVFRGLLLAFCFHDRFSNVKLDGNKRICMPRRRTDRRGANFVKLG